MNQTPTQLWQDAMRTRIQAVGSAYDVVANHFQNYVQSYANSQRSRLKPGTRGQAGSADAQLDPRTRDELRRECQAVLRNSPVARALSQRLIDLTVGDGMGVRAQTDNPDWNKRAERGFNRWCERFADCRGTRSFWMMLHEVIRAMLTDGDMLAIKVSATDTRPPCLQLIESERIASGGAGARIVAASATMGTERTGDEYEYDGIVTDDVGRPLRFLVRSWTRQGTSTRDSNPIDAENCIWLVNPRSQAVNLTRGEPALQAVLDDLERLTQIMDSAAVSYHVATLLSALVTTDNPQDLQLALSTQSQDQTGITPETGQPKETSLSPGSIMYLPTGSQVSQMKPEHPSTNHKEFVLLQIQMIAADLGLPLILTHLDFSQVNFHSGKSAMSVAGLSINVWQSWLIERIIKPAWEMWVQWAIETGQLEDQPGWESVEVIPNPIPSIDFEKEVTGLVAAVNANLITQKQAVQRLTGGDLESTYAQRSIEKRTEIELGIAPPLAPGTATGAPAEPAQPNTGAVQA